MIRYYAMLQNCHSGTFAVFDFSFADHASELIAEICLPKASLSAAVFLIALIL
jgi:hypothetical protein